MTYTERLIKLTLEKGSSYLPFQEILPRIPSTLPLSLEQEQALALSLGGSPLMTIVGVIGSGKTRLIQVLAETLLKADQKFLLLTKYPHIYRQSLEVVPQMDYLPLGSLPDTLLQKLRTPSKLMKWVTILQEHPDLLSQLQIEFPHLSTNRLEILAYRLKELLPLLREQLSLEQLFQGIDRTSNLFTLSTLDNLATVEGNYNCILVEDAHTLSLQQIYKLASQTNRLILVGDSPLYSGKENDFYNLYNRLLPNYRYYLSQQYRLHPVLAESIFRTLYDQLTYTVFTGDRLDLSQLRGRLIWQDVRTESENGINQREGNRLFRFLEQFQNVPREKIGILTFTSSQKEWLNNNYPPSLPRVFIGTPQDYQDKQKHLLLVSCVGLSEMTEKDYALSLTRGLDYLVFFGNTQIWKKSDTPLGYLLRQPELLLDREVTFR